MGSTPASRVSVSSSEARARAKALIVGLERNEPGALDQLRDDAFGHLGRRTDIAIRVVPDAQADAGCSVAGAYIAGTKPPVLAVANSTSAGRRAFTLLHEYAHHLQQTDVALMDDLLAQPDGGNALEDAACNSFAAHVLIPDSMFSHIPSQGPTAPDVTAAWRASRASRAAVCVRAAERLATPGHILLLDSQGVVQLAMANRLPPLRRGSNQSDVPVVAQAVASDTHAGRSPSRFEYRDGILGAELHAQAADIGGFIVVVAVTDHAPWERFTLPSMNDRPAGRSWTCEQCGDEFTTFEPGCRTCGAPQCPECGRCNCQPRVAERTCQGCFLLLPERMFSSKSPRCIECS